MISECNRDPKLFKVCILWKINESPSSFLNKNEKVVPMYILLWQKYHKNIFTQVGMLVMLGQVCVCSLYPWLTPTSTKSTQQSGSMGFYSIAGHNPHIKTSLFSPL